MVTLSKIYTRTGDHGMTRLIGGQAVRKNDLRVETYGTIDELNAIIGLCRSELLAPSDGHALPAADVARFDAWFLTIQQQLFNLGCDLATRFEDRRPGHPALHPDDAPAIERFIDAENAHLGILKSFVLPGGTRLNALLHLARTVCRRAERLIITLSDEATLAPEVIPWVNRLSDALFVLSRRASQLVAAPEVLWTP